MYNCVFCGLLPASSSGDSCRVSSFHDVVIGEPLWSIFDIEASRIDAALLIDEFVLRNVELVPRLAKVTLWGVPGDLREDIIDDSAAAAAVAVAVVES